LAWAALHSDIKIGEILENIETIKKMMLDFVGNPN
jgi:hypothetical protein